MIEEAARAAVTDDAGSGSWDYQVKSVHARHDDGLENELVRQGRAGWELVFVNMPMAHEYQCIFKRNSR